MKRSGYSDLPLHGGHVPQWLAQRMQKLGGAISEAIVQEYGKAEFLRRMSDPGWFQALGSVMGMDWHSSGITTSVLGALKRAINPASHELGIHICGGRGKQSRQTPNELYDFGYKTGLNAQNLVHSSKLSAKIDNTAIQDGFQLYLHAFILTDEGEWTVIQQGMNNGNGMARRYHWHSRNLQSFVNAPHTSVYGQNQGQILNLTDPEADPTRTGILDLSREKPQHLLPEVKKMTMPNHHDVYQKDVNLKRLGSVLALARETEIKDFENLLMIKGMGPRTLQSLTLVSEVIHGTPSRFSDPGRYAFAHGGKDKKPFPVPTKVYDKTIEVLETSVKKAKIGQTDKQKALKSLHKTAKQMEQSFEEDPGGFEQLKKHENSNSWKYGGRSVFGKEQPPKSTSAKGYQLDLF